MAFDYSAGFEPADRLAQDRDSLRRRFWIKLKQVAARLPFTEDLLAAYYCAFDKETPRHVQAALLGAIAYFVLPFDFIPDMMPVLAQTSAFTLPCRRPTNRKGRRLSACVEKLKGMDIVSDSASMSGWKNRLKSTRPLILSLSSREMNARGLV